MLSINAKRDMGVVLYLAALLSATLRLLCLYSLLTYRYKTGGTQAATHAMPMNHACLLLFNSFPGLVTLTEKIDVMNTMIRTAKATLAKVKIAESAPCRKRLFSIVICAK